MADLANEGEPGLQYCRIWVFWPKVCTVMFQVSVGICSLPLEMTNVLQCFCKRHFALAVSVSRSSQIKLDQAYQVNTPSSPSLSPEQRGSSPWIVSVASSGLAPAAPNPPDVGAPDLDAGFQSPAEQKALSDSGEDPQGEVEPLHHGVGHTEPAGERDSEHPAPTVASVSATLSPASEAQLAPIQLAGRSADGSSPEDGDESDREDGSYCPPVKRERTSSLTQFPPQSVTKNNVFMPSSFCEPSTGNSDSEPEEKSSGFRLKPPILIHGQAPSAVLSSGTNGVNIPPDSTATSELPSDATLKSSDSEEKAEECQKKESNNTSDNSCEKAELNAQQAFVFGQNLRDRVKLGDEGDETADVQNAGLPTSDTPSATNYFLQYISSSVESSTNSADASSNKFVFGQNMSERVLSPPKSNEGSTESNKENAATESGSESSSQEATPEKANNISESLAESAAAYTKATARKCLLAKVEVITGEEAESNVLQIQCKLFVFDKSSQSWVERGRGLLRLNDMASTDDGTLQSRLVMRTQGSLRLILNTKLWAQMQIDKASEKSIRITAMDTEDQGVKVFLISASSKDTGQLFAALHHRILALRSRVEQEQEVKNVAPEPEVTQSNEEDSDDDVIAPSGSVGSATLGAVFGLSTCLSAQVREEPEDPLNYFIGGCAAGAALGARGKMWVAEGSAPTQWSLRDGTHAGHFLAMADNLRTTGQLVDVAVGPEGDKAHAVVLASISSFFLCFLEGRTRELHQDSPLHVPLPPGATLQGWRAMLTFAYRGMVPHGQEKEVEEAARALGAPRLVAACTLRLEIDPKEEGPEPLEEQWETLRAMEQLHANGLGCDLQLQAGDEVIPVQRLALSCSCDFFRALFTCPMREATHDPAAPLVTGLSPAELRLLLSFAYTGAVAGPWPMVLEAAETSLRYQAWGLLTLCLDVFTHGLTPETVPDVLAFAVTYGLDEVGHVAENYILATFPSVVATPAFLDLPAHLLIRLLRSDGLNVLHELEALEAASRWLMANGDGQEDLAKEVLSSVRFALMSGLELKKVPSVTAGVADPKVLRELVVSSFAPMAQLPCRIRSLQEVLVVCGGDKVTGNLAARKPSRHLWFADRYLSAVGLVKQVEWRALGHFPDGPRFRHAITVVGNNLYVLGGKHYYGVHDTLTSVYRYQPMDDSWERLASMTCGRSYFAAVALGNFIYALGGSSGELYCTDTVECYDLANDTWRRCQPLLTALCGHAACALDGALYVSGGCDDACQCQASLLRYVPGASATFLAPMNGERAGHIMEEAGGQLYVAGGLCQRAGQTGYRDQLTFEVYKPKQNIWVVLSPLPRAHVVGGAAVLGGELLVLGGYSHETYQDTHLIHAYQPGAQRWITRGTLPHAYTDLQACVLTVPTALRGPSGLKDPLRSPQTPNNT
ncbi:hypothetical protein BTVI_44565 [Pitangus sulphuratus]|nr:hypothetical protein BTVI_44565 [Pitangus sulphuratus]